MNVRLEKSFDFLASAYLNGQVFCNKYKLEIEFFTNTMDGYEQNTALDRVRHMLYHKFSNSLFIDQADQDKAQQFEQLGFQTVSIPGPAVEQLIGILLFVKLNAVMENRLIITQLKLCSELADNMWYCQDGEEDFGPFEEDGWWHESGDNLKAGNSQAGKIVELNKTKKGWHSVGLDWDQTGDDSTVFTLVDDY